MKGVKVIDKMSTISLSLLFLFGIVACKNDCMQIQVPYTVEEPYEAFEKKFISLPYNVEESSWSRETGAILLDQKPKLTSFMIVTNAGEKGGVFKVKKKYNTSLDTVLFQDSKYIGPGQTGRFDFSRELDYYTQVKSEGYTITSPKVEIVEKVTKMKKVTKFRTCDSCDPNCK